KYNERVQLDARAVSDEQLCAAFTAVHAALNDISLTYFEFGTLAALWLFQQAHLDLIVLEVGLGGRLDAVNIIDTDAAVLTLIDLDHQDWLGHDRETIGAEKAGIFRAGRPAICVDPAPPQSVVTKAQAIGAQWYASGGAFSFSQHGGGWNWSGTGLPVAADYAELPLPILPLPSAAAALAALHCLPLTITRDAIEQGLRSVALPGRFQRALHLGIEIILDVGHNPQAARWLAQRLAQLPPVPTHAVFAIMADKDVDAVIAPLAQSFADWHIGDLADNPRALNAVELEKLLSAQAAGAVNKSATLTEAFANAVRNAGAGERIVVFGSFFTVAAALEYLHERAIA